MFGYRPSFGTSVYFTNVEDTKDFTDLKNSTHRAVWMWEGETATDTKDVWICYWWSVLLAEDYRYGTREGRRKGFQGCLRPKPKLSSPSS